MKEYNVILISVDEVRLDHLSCYGYEKIRTENIDRIAKEGVLFETCVAPDSLTPIVMSSVITASYPYRHGLRDPFCRLNGKTIAEILKDCGYKTAGFVGNGLLDDKHGFRSGFDEYDQPSSETAWRTETYPDETGITVYEGNWWVDRMLSWIDSNSSSKFFVWGHYFETHEGSEVALLREGWLKEDELSEFGYYDAKIKLMDDKLVGQLLALLDKKGLAENTILVFMADHGTNLGERPAPPLPWRKSVTYPQHTTLYDHDLKVCLLMSNSQLLPSGKRITGMVRSIDVVPTILELLEIPHQEFKFDGESLTRAIKQGKTDNKTEAYAEDLFEKRGPGVLQAVRTDTWKFIRNLSTGDEEYYDLLNDPGEIDNNIDDARRKKEDFLREMRNRLTSYLWRGKQADQAFSEGERKNIEERLQALGYVK